MRVNVSSCVRACVCESLCAFVRACFAFVRVCKCSCQRTCFRMCVLLSVRAFLCVCLRVLVRESLCVNVLAWVFGCVRTYVNVSVRSSMRMYLRAYVLARSRMCSCS